MTLKKLFVVGFVAAFLVACGDDGDCNPVNNSDEDSSSSKTVILSGDSREGSSSSSKAKSSSSSAKSSSSSAKSSSSVAYVEPCRTDSVDTCEYGELVDERDGQTYKTVKIGTQTWMAENLNYAYLQQTRSFDSISWCYNDSVEYCAKYGRLYTWAAAMDSAGTWSANGKGCGYGKTCSPTYPVRGVCPEGWHLPTQMEGNTLFTAVGGELTAGKMLKSTSGWIISGNGTDAYSFSALPAGRRFNKGGYYDEGHNAHFWSSTEDDSDDAYDMYLFYYYAAALLTDFTKYNGFSVRCLKD